MSAAGDRAMGGLPSEGSGGRSQSVGPVLGFGDVRDRSERPVPRVGTRATSEKIGQSK